MTDSVTGTTQAPAPQPTTASSSSQTTNDNNENTSESILETPSVLIRDLFDERVDIIREFERSQERREERDEGVSTPIDRLRQREEAAESRAGLSEAERDQILFAAQQASAQLSLQLASTLSNGLASALEFYQGFNER